MRVRRKLVKWTLITVGSLAVVFIGIGIIAVATDRGDEPEAVRPVATEPHAPAAAESNSQWVRQRTSPGTEWAKPGDPAYQRAKPEPERETVSSTPAGTSGVTPRPRAVVTQGGYLESTDEKCVRIMARNQEDLRAARTLCSAFDPGLIIGVTSDGTLLNIWVGPALATDMLIDEAATKRVVLSMMDAWKRLAG